MISYSTIFPVSNLTTRVFETNKTELELDYKDFETNKTELENVIKTLKPSSYSNF